MTDPLTVAQLVQILTTRFSPEHRVMIAMDDGFGRVTLSTDKLKERVALKLSDPILGTYWDCTTREYLAYGLVHRTVVEQHPCVEIALQDDES